MNADRHETPQLTLRGSILASAPTTVQPAEAALLWSGFDPSVEGGLRLVGNAVPVTGAFPSSFEMNIYAPPNDAALLPLGDGEGFPLVPGQPAETAVGYVVALGASANHTDVNPPDILGTSPDAIVFYNKHAIAPGTPTAKLLTLFNAPTTAGYHLISIVQPTAPQRAAFVRCKTGGVCVKTMMAADAPPADVAYGEQDFSSCMAATPAATVCNVWATPAPSSQQQQETSSCNELAKAKAGKDCPHPWSFSEASQSTTVTVAMGTKPWELFR